MRVFPLTCRPTRLPAGLGLGLGHGHGGAVTTDPTTELTVVNGQAGTLRSATLAQLVG